jgi:hypothetical protein
LFIIISIVLAVIDEVTGSFNAEIGIGLLGRHILTGSPDSGDSRVGMETS